MKRLFISLVLILSGCGLHSSDEVIDPGTPSPTAESEYSFCDPVPSNPLPTNHNCPGPSLSWNNYEIKKDATGMVISVELWCGGSSTDHPADQYDYNSIMIVAGEATNNDYKNGLACVSGTKTTPVGTTSNIWQMQK